MPPPSLCALVVIDTLASRELLRVTGYETSHALLSNDGATLATASTEQVTPDERHFRIRVWDVSAWKPLHWTIGVPASLFALCVLSSWWRARRRAKKTGGPPSAS